MSHVLKLTALICSVVIVSCGSSRINDDPSAHSRMVAKSKSERSIIVSMDTVFSAGSPYAILDIGGIANFAEIYTFKSITGKECIEVMPWEAGDGTTYHQYEFKEGTSKGMKGYLDFSLSTMTVCENVINNSLMNSTSLRSVDVGNFVDDNPRPPAFDAAKLKVRRERATKVEVKADGFGGNIAQSGKKIGTYSRSTKSSGQGGFEWYVYTVKFVNGTEMATVRVPWDKFDRKNGGIMEIETEYDGKLNAIDINEKNASFDIDSFEQACAWLVEKGYL